MKLLLSYESHSMLTESCNLFEKEIDTCLTEALGDVIGSPIKYIKIKNNAKKYQKSLVQQSLNDLDHAKKKSKSKGERTKEETEVLNQANKAKNAALKNQATTISMRMDTLAANDGLKKVATLAKSKAKVAAAEIAIKAAGDTESAMLKVRIKKNLQKAKNAEQALKDYESTAKNTDDGVAPDAVADTLKDKKPGKKEIEAVEANITKIKKTIKDAKHLIDKQKEAGNDNTVKKAQEILTKKEKELKAAETTLEGMKGKSNESNFTAQYYYLLETLDEIEGDLEVLKRSLNV